MVSGASHGARWAGAALAAFLLSPLASGRALLGQVPKADRTGINMTAQDATGAVWSTKPGQPQGLYRWENGHWAPARAKMPEGSAAVGVWKGLEGGVVVGWQAGPPGVQLSWYRGSESKPLGRIEGEMSNPRVFSTPPDNLWITTNPPSIYRLEPDGRMPTRYLLRPEQFFPYRHRPGEGMAYAELAVATDDQGRTWFWARSFQETVNMATLEGFVIYDGRSFEYRRSLPGLPSRPLSYLGPADGGHLWAATIAEGLYSIDTRTMTAERVPGPPTRPLDLVTKVFRTGKDTYVGTEAPSLVVQETREHRLSGILWRLRNGQWQEILPGVDDLAELQKDFDRPWLVSPEGLWVGSHAAGLWFISSRDEVPRIINWKQGFPLASVDRLYALGDGRLLAVSDQPARAAAAEIKPLLEPATPPVNAQVFNPYSALQQDPQFRLWGILALASRTLDEWDGQKWIAHPLPGNISPSWLSGVDADSQGRIWLFPDCRQGPMAIFDPGDGSWKGYDSYQAALEAARSPVRFLHPDDDGMKPIYGPGRQIAFMGACNGINYFDGNGWQLWNRPDVPGEWRYFFDGPAFFDKAGHLAVDIHHETWEQAPESGWHVIPYEPEQGRLGRWFAPSPPAPVPSGCDAGPSSTSLVQDRLGRSWWTELDSVFAGVPGRCRRVLESGQAQPFIDGRLLRRVLVDHQGNLFFETLLAGDRVGEYVMLSQTGPFPQIRIRLTELGPDTFRANFSTSGRGTTLFTWRLDGGNWSAPQEEASTLIPSLLSGEHRLEAASIDSNLQMDPVPASATLTVRVNAQEQISELVARLSRATSDDEREAVLELLGHQPPALTLPALEAARAKATGDERWWVEAAIQQIQQRQKP